jgi:ABC-type uncharacterized transport system substrate-binding protein
MSKKISFLLILVLTLCLAGHSWAYEAAVLKSANIRPYNDALRGFQSSCGCSVTTVTPEWTGDSSLGEEISRLHPDVVLAIGMDALAQVRTITDLPVIYVMVPGRLTGGKAGKASGVSMYISPSRYLDAMTRLFPTARRIGLVYDPKNSDAYVKEAMRAAAVRGIDLVVKRADTAASVPALMDGLKGRIDLFWMLPEPALLNSATVDYMFLFSFEGRVPIFTFSKKYVDMGAAVALTVDSFDMGAQAGNIAKRLQGAGNAGKIRVDAHVSGLVINRKVLEKLGIRVNAKTIGRAENAD